MQTSQKVSSFEAPAWLRRPGAWAARVWRRLFLRGDVTALLLAVGIVLVPGLAMRAAAWTEGLEQLVPIIILSVVFGFLLARSHYGELLSLLISSVYSLGFIGVVTAQSIEGGTLLERVAIVFTRSVAWLHALTSGGIAQDNLVFVLFLSVLFWFLGHNTAWHIFRIDRVWRAVLPAGFVILVNIFYYTGELSLGIYLAVYAVFALLLLVRSTIDAQEWGWYLKRMSLPAGLRNQFLRWGAVLALVLVGVAWTLPTGTDGDNLDRVQEFLNSDPLDQLNDLFNRLFASLENEGLVTADYYGGNSLQLGGAIQLGDQPVMLVEAPPMFGPEARYYWRSRTFSQYEGGRWTPTSAVRLTVPEAGFAVQNAPVLPEARQSVEQTMTMVINASRLVYAAPQPAILNLPVSLDMSYVDDTQRQIDVSVIRPLDVLRTGDTYSAVSSISVADAPMLRTAGTVYPRWVVAEYLQVGDSVTPRTRELAFQVVTEANALTPYDQAKAIERWLRTNITYDETIPGPPPGVDPVDWVLFDEQRGYCNYYASAMIMMLRSVGVPARMAAGFSQGEWTGESGSYLVRERDAHTWVEVFFPGFGWVEFEPTAAQSPLDRPDVVPQTEGDQIPTQTPFPTNTPQPTATPTLVAPPTETPDGSSGGPVIPPTVTPMPSPTPTSTPVVMPTITGPEQQETQMPSILSAILSAIVTVLVVLAVALLFILVLIFIVWWLEWRGLGGLSPVQRAYALLERYAGYLGIRLADSYTPNERQRVLMDRVPTSEKPVRVITDLYVNETYGPETKPRSRWAIAARAALSDLRRIFLRVQLARFIPFRRRRR